MNFLEAVRKAEEGKKVILKRKAYDIMGWRLVIENNIPKLDNGNLINSVPIGAIYSDGWELLEENKTLSDKRLKDRNRGDEPFFYEEDIKEHLKEFIEYVNQSFNDDVFKINKELLKKAKEIFGDDLIGQ